MDFAQPTAVFMRFQSDADAIMAPAPLEEQSRGNSSL
jgi:hypothetical protein